MPRKQEHSSHFPGGLGALVLAAALGAGCASDAGKNPPAGGQKGVDLSCPGEALSPAPLRRLTRFEYQNAISDVLGADVAVDDLFPKDEVALGFDNQSGTLVGSSRVDLQACKLEYSIVSPK